MNGASPSSFYVLSELFFKISVYSVSAMEARKVPSKALLSTPTKRHGLVSSLLPSSPRNGGRDLAAKWGPARKVLTTSR